MSVERYRRAVELLEAEVGDDIVALEPDEGTCFGFNAVAADVWRTLENPRTFEEIRSELLAHYEVSLEECTTGLRELLMELKRAKLVACEVSDN